MAEEEDYGLEAFGDDDPDATDTCGGNEEWDAPIGEDDEDGDLSAFDVDISEIKNSHQSSSADMFSFNNTDSGAVEGEELPVQDVDQGLASMLQSMVIPESQLSASTSTPERTTSRFESRLAAAQSQSSGSPFAGKPYVGQVQVPITGSEQMVALGSIAQRLQLVPRGSPQSSETVPSKTAADLTVQQQQFLMQLLRKKAAVVESNQQPQQQQQQREQQQPSQQQPARRQRWNKDSDMMSADEIDMIIRIQEQQLGTDANPFLEDYYCQQYQLLQNPRKYQLHRPIMDPVVQQARPQRRPGSGASSTPTKDSGKDKQELEKEKEDPFQNVLGRIPSHSVRAPRPLLVFESELENRANDDTLNETAVVLRSALQRIESAFLTVLELEDLVQLIQQINSLVSQAPSPAQAQLVLQQLQANFNLGTLLHKRQQHCAKLVSQLGLVPPAESAFDEYRSWIDSLLVTLLIPKGTRVFSRALPLLLSPAASRDGAGSHPVLSEHLDSFVRATLRCCATLSVAASSERQQLDLILVADTVRSTISRAEVQQFTSFLGCFASEAAGHSQTSHSFVRVIASTKFGAHILTSLLKRLYELCQSPSNLGDVERVNTWRAFFNLVFSALAGQFAQLQTSPVAILSSALPILESCRSTLSSLGITASSWLRTLEFDSSVGLVTAPLTTSLELVLYIAANAAAHQKLQMQLELSPIVPALLRDPSTIAPLHSLSKLLGTPVPPSSVTS